MSIGLIIFWIAVVYFFLNVITISTIHFYKSPHNLTGFYFDMFDPKDYIYNNMNKFMVVFHQILLGLFCGYFYIGYWVYRLYMVGKQ